jgi:hypothetical protein
MFGEEAGEVLAEDVGVPVGQARRPVYGLDDGVARRIRALVRGQLVSRSRVTRGRHDGRSIGSDIAQLRA